MKICNHAELLELWNIWRLAEEKAANAKALYWDAVEYVNAYGYGEPAPRTNTVLEGPAVIEECTKRWTL